MNNLLTVQNIFYSISENNFSLNEGDRKEILKDISFTLESGKILGISGESGSGKTTLSKICAGVKKPTSGKILYNFKNDWEKIRTSPVQILFQNNGEILNPLRQIDKIVEETILIRTKNKKEISKRKEEIFNSLNFPEHLWQRKGFELSGGEQQRAALSRILAAEPELLVLDEPFSAQDPESQFNLFNLFKKINKNFNITLICVAHNLKILKKLCDEILILYKGETVEKGEAQNIFSAPKHPYTKFLLNAESYNLPPDKLYFEDVKSE